MALLANNDIGRPLASLPSIANHQYLFPQKSPAEHLIPFTERASAKGAVSGHSFQYHIPNADQLPYGFPGGPQTQKPVLEGVLPCVPIDVENLKPGLERVFSEHTQPVPVLQPATSYYVRVLEENSKPIIVRENEESVQPIITRENKESFREMLMSRQARQAPRQSFPEASDHRKRAEEQMVASAAERRQSTAPERLPFQLEHAVLCDIQSLVEVALFEFASMYMPEVLQEHNWQTAEAGELNRYVLLVTSLDSVLKSNVPPQLA